MTGLATEFLSHSHQWKVEPDLVQKIMENNLDIEHLIEELDRICMAESSLTSIGHDTDGLESVAKVRAEVEWFVQHAAERVSAKEACLMWGEVLRATEKAEISFVTTNYDRAIELAANGVGVRLDDGFEIFAEEEIAKWVGFKENEYCPTLIKLHGSTDWFADEQVGDPMKLRHPMPLFGRSVLMLETQKFNSALVLPSREKMLTKAPYPRLSQAFLNAADGCDLALFVGTSLRDPHIRNAVQSVAAKNIPVFIVGPGVSPFGRSGETAVVSQHASTFLISTLPNALCASDPISVLQNSSHSDSPATTSIFPAVRDLLNTDARAIRRCQAIEELDKVEATLAPALIEQLLGDGNSTVARYTLGLIPQSTSYTSLVEIASNCPHIGDPAFREELDILHRFISSC